MLEQQTGTLSGLLNLSDSLPKHDAYFTGVVSKVLDTIKNLVGDKNREELESYAQVDTKLLTLPYATFADSERDRSTIYPLPLTYFPRLDRSTGGIGIAHVGAMMGGFMMLSMHWSR